MNEHKQNTTKVHDQAHYNPCLAGWASGGVRPTSEDACKTWQGVAQVLGSCARRAMGSETPCAWRTLCERPSQRHPHPVSHWWSWNLSQCWVHCMGLVLPCCRSFGHLGLQVPVSPDPFHGDAHEKRHREGGGDQPWRRDERPLQRTGPSSMDIRPRCRARCQQRLTYPTWAPCSPGLSGFALRAR